MPRRSILARRPSNLDRAWADRVVAEAGFDCRVERVECREVATGTTTRVKLGIYDVAGRCLDCFVKLPSVNWRARWITAAAGVCHNEVRFYTEIAPCLPIEHVTCYAGAARRGYGFTLVLEDLAADGADGAEVLEVGGALAVPEVESAVVMLADLHAAFSGHPMLRARFAWLDGPARRLEDLLGTVLAVPLMRRGLRSSASLVPEHLHEPAMRYASHRGAWMQALRATNDTLVHRDVHVGNLFWREGRSGLLDWQLARVGEGLGDVAYLLATSLTPVQRRAHETGLLSTYVKRMAEHGKAAVGEQDSLEQRYRLHLSYAF
jgi:hypothetical protein